MSNALLETEGTWREIIASTTDFGERRVRVIVLPIEETDPPSSVDDTLTRIWETVPETSWQTLPEDFGSQMDHYLYKVPKK